MSSTKFNKNRKPKKLYSEAYCYQELGAFMLAYLRPPNMMAASKGQHVAGLWLTVVADKFIERIKERDGIVGHIPAGTVAFESVASIVRDLEAIPKRIRGNVWKG